MDNRTDVQLTDHWIVCSGMKVLSELLASYQSAREEAEKHIRDGRELISIQHVGASPSERQEAERRMLREPFYRMGDPYVNPDDRIF